MRILRLAALVICAPVAFAQQWSASIGAGPFIFGDFADDARDTRSEIEETTLSDDGSAVVDVPFQVSDARSPIRVRASLSLLESGGRPVVRSIERIWWPAPALIAVWSPGAAQEPAAVPRS